MVIPLGTRFNQIVYLVDKHDGKVDLKPLKPTLFVPMTGRAQREAAEARAAKKAREGRASRDPDGRAVDERGSAGPRDRLGGRHVLRHSGRRFGWAIRAAILAAAWGWPRPGRRSLRTTLIERPGPPALDDLETDANKDGIPDGWYNARDVSWVAEGGVVGPHFLRFELRRAGPARPAQPRLRGRRPQDRGDPPGPLGPARTTSSSASGPAPSRAC